MGRVKCLPGGLCHLWGCRKKRQKRSQTEAKQDISLYLEVSSVRLSRHSLCVDHCGSGPVLALCFELIAQKWSSLSRMLPILWDSWTPITPCFTARELQWEAKLLWVLSSVEHEVLFAKRHRSQMQNRVFSLVFFSLGAQTHLGKR